MKRSFLLAMTGILLAGSIAYATGNPKDSKPGTKSRTEKQCPKECPKGCEKACPYGCPKGTCPKG